MAKVCHYHNPEVSGQHPALKMKNKGIKKDMAYKYYQTEK